MKKLVAIFLSMITLVACVKVTMNPAEEKNVESYMTETVIEESEANKEGNFDHTYGYETLPPLNIENSLENVNGKNLVDSLEAGYVKYMSTIPVELTSLLKENGTVVYFVSDLAPYFGSDSSQHLNGFIRNHDIFVKADYSANDPYWYLILYHEVGHALDFAFGHPSQSPEFKALYDEEFTEEVSSHDENNPAEFFADTFKMYAWLLNFNEAGIPIYCFTKKIPKTKAFVQDTLKLPDV